MCLTRFLEIIIATITQECIAKNASGVAMQMNNPYSKTTQLEVPDRNLLLIFNIVSLNIPDQKEEIIQFRHTMSQLTYHCRRRRVNGCSSDCY